MRRRSGEEGELRSRQGRGGGGEGTSRQEDKWEEEVEGRGE